MVEDAGHAALEPGIASALVAATDSSSGKATLTEENERATKKACTKTLDMKHNFQQDLIFVIFVRA